VTGLKLWRKQTVLKWKTIKIIGKPTRIARAKYHTLKRNKDKIPALENLFTIPDFITEKKHTTGKTEIVTYFVANDSPKTTDDIICLFFEAANKKSINAIDRRVM
jgi:hypothetical protein